MELRPKLHHSNSHVDSAIASQQQSKDPAQVQEISQKNFPQKSEIKKHVIHFFINSLSGHQSGKKFLAIPDLKLNFELDDKLSQKKVQTELLFHDLCNKETREKGFALLKQQQIEDPSNKYYSIVGGGDGTVLWVVDEMAKAGCDFDKVVIGVIAIGTGNDFSRATGWGPDQCIKNLLQNNYKQLKALVLQYIQSSTCYFDLWDYKIDLFEGGYFLQIKKNKDGTFEKIKLKEPNTTENLKVFEKTMSNYFSIGIDARIGYGFDKRRTASRHKNKCFYCWEGFKKMFLKNKNIPETLDKLITIQSGNDKIPSNNNSTTSSQKTQDKMLFTTSKPEKTQKEKETQNIMVNNPVNIVILNINSYAAGVHGVWQNSGSGSIKQTTEKANKYQIPDQHKQYTEQSFSDKKIEMVSFGSILNISNERVIGGQSNKIAQGEGPFVFYYKQHDKKGELLKSYFQIDGEYYAVVGAKSITCQSSQKVPNGQMKIIVNQKSYSQIKSNGQLLTESKLMQKQSQQSQ